jgi:hypothetical protein
MKAKDAERLSVLRMLKSEVQYEMTKTGASELPDTEVEAVIKRAVKKRKDSADQYRKAGREDLAVVEEKELEILKEYLPEELSAEAVEKIVDEAIEAVKPGGPSDMGKVMGFVMGRLKGQNVDGAVVKELVQSRLKS